MTISLPLRQTYGVNLQDNELKHIASLHFGSRCPLNPVSLSPLAQPQAKFVCGWSGKISDGRKIQMQQEDNTTLLKAFGSFKSLRFSASLCFLFQTFGKLMLPSRETNLGEPNGEIGISNSVAVNLWY